ncbi:MAG: hypothetical protein KatS3mg111_3431 [Pirellulaceae bacterium]|nr:MAG: hypothetical protein KatS3mg111_3431 [Pirellulaceae bacterium]
MANRSGNSFWPLMTPTKPLVSFLDRPSRRGEGGVSNRRQLFGWLAVASTGWAARRLQATPAEPVRIDHNLCTLSTTRDALRRGQTPTGFLWDNKPLREGVVELATSRGLNVWIDRRLDPSLPLTLQFPGPASYSDLFTALRQVAATAGAGVGLVENTIYLGPPDVAPRVATAAVRFYDQLVRHAGDASDRPHRTCWPDITSYQSLAEQICALPGWPLASKLPHDLLHAGCFEIPCTVATQLTLLAAGFDMEPAVRHAGSEVAIQFQPLSATTVWTADYPRQQLVGLDGPPERAIAFAQRHGGSIRRHATEATWEISGPTDFHLRCLVPAAPPPRATNAIFRQRWTFEVRHKPAKVVLDSLAASIGFQPQWSTAASEVAGKRISFRIENADLDALLQAFAQASGLSVTRQGLDVLVDR